jgi:hypothetical protein
MKNITVFAVISLVLSCVALPCVALPNVEQSDSKALSAVSRSTAIEFVKQNHKIKAYLKNKNTDKYSIEFNEVKLGGVCGFTGCQWRTLVSLIVTAKLVNAPSTTILAIVKGRSPVGSSEPTIHFVDFKAMDESKWLTKL